MEQSIERDKNVVDEHSELYKSEARNLSEAGDFYHTYVWERIAELDKKYNEDIIPGQHQDVSAFMGALLDFVDSKGEQVESSTSQIMDEVAFTSITDEEKTALVVELAFALADRDRLGEVDQMMDANPLIVERYFDQILLAKADSYVRQDDVDKAMRTIYEVRMSVGEKPANRMLFKRVRDSIGSNGTAIQSKRSW